MTPYIQRLYLPPVPRKKPGPSPHSSFRLSEEGKALLAALAQRNGLTMTAMLEALIRMGARSAGMVKG